MSNLSPEQARLDPYTSAAENTDLTLQEKITGTAFHTNNWFMNAKIGMLVTRDENGNLHSRAMTPATPYSDTAAQSRIPRKQCVSQVRGISRMMRTSMSASVIHPLRTWASYSGRAKVTQDKELIHKHWSSCLASPGYIGDLKDGIHKGDMDDPRVAVIEVIPDEIKYLDYETLFYASVRRKSL
ncbi:hypothetical protein DFH29DRAFT_1068020 [Suillus ampliporus]|nr:hypothetical protein DFH29DRAFT_1068020 [Suillus ampliporus]